MLFDLLAYTKSSSVVIQNFNLLPHFSVWVKLLMFEAFYCL